MTTATVTTRSRNPSRVALAAALRNLATSLRASVALWSARSAERRALLEMDERALSDIGISRYEALIEGAKPWWRP